jgi:hypothetical protein
MMRKRQQDSDPKTRPTGVNPGYAAIQLAKALTTSEEHQDAETRERAKEKISRWKRVLENVLTGSVEYGSRTPVKHIPAWATLEVVTGGFATGGLLAGGPLQEHEKALLEDLMGAEEGGERRALNAYFLTDAGLERLQDQLRTGCYDVAVPEEGALLVVAWLVENGFTEDARDLIEELSPHFPSLRFYPIPLATPRRVGSRVHVQDAGRTLEDLRRIRPNHRILAQKEAVEIWAPFYDRVVALFLETVEDDWPCQCFPEGWPDRALALLGEYAILRKAHTLCGKMERGKEHSAQLLDFLGRCARQPDGLTGLEVGRIRLILHRYVAKRGTPESPRCTEARRRQAAEVSGPTFYEVGKVVASRLEGHPKDDGLDDVSHLHGVVTAKEAENSGVPEGTAIPLSIRRKVERCLNETVDVLVERGLITSGETLGKVLPQMTSGLRATGITDATLRQLYAAIYRAFRRRRSLLLLNLEKQVQVEELPWIAAIDRFRRETLSTRELARQTIEELAVVTLTSFPQAILPNKLLQEFRVLATGADLKIPLVDELAADIFMGEFSGKFIESARTAADLLTGSLYATYYGIDYEAIRRLPEPKRPPKRTWFWRPTSTSPDTFAQLCATRAGVSLGTWDPATNGMIIEQQQILTTQNLAALFMGLGLPDVLRGQLYEMARQCFRWVVRRQQMRVDRWHARLIMLKNTAYAWRQMVFFLALLPDGSVADFLQWAEGHLDAQREEYRNRFRPALKGLALAADGRSLDSDSMKELDARRFLGWSKTRHWLLIEPQGP